MCHCTNTLTESRVLCQCQRYGGWKEFLLVGVCCWDKVLVHWLIDDAYHHLYILCNLPRRNSSDTNQCWNRMQVFPKHYYLSDLSKRLDSGYVCFGHPSDDTCPLLLCPEALLGISLSYPMYGWHRLWWSHGSRTGPLVFFTVTCKKMYIKITDMLPKALLGSALRKQIRCLIKCVDKNLWRYHLRLINGQQKFRGINWFFQISHKRWDSAPGPNTCI